MGILSELKSVRDDFEKIATSNKPDTQVGYKLDAVMQSISSRAAKCTYYFPVLLSKNISSDGAQLILDDLENNYAHFMRACFALTPAISTKSNDIRVEEYLDRFHKNTGIANDKYQVRLMFNKSMKEDFEEYKLLVNEPLNELAAPIPENPVDPNNPAPDPANPENTVPSNPDQTPPADTPTPTEVRVNTGNSDKEKDNKSRKNSKDHGKPINTNWISEGFEKKANTAEPTVIPVKCTFLKDTQEIDVNVPVGIKCVLHLCDPTELADRVITTLTGRGLIRNIIKWTSGEVDSLGDVIFGIDELKKNVRGDTEVARWFDVIERRSRINSLKPFIFGQKPYLPNMSIALSMEDINEIERKSRVNILKNPRFAAKLIKECYLISLVICDDASQTMYVMYDGHSEFEDIPFASLKRGADKEANAIDRLSKVLGIVR